MKPIRFLAIAALFAPYAAFAHPGHGSVPASEAGRPPHVHFGAAGKPQTVVAPRIADTAPTKPAAVHAQPVSNKAVRRKPTR